MGGTDHKKLVELYAADKLNHIPIIQLLKMM